MVILKVYRLISSRLVNKMTLPQKDLASLLSVLSEDKTATQTFEALASLLHHYFTKNDHFRVGMAMVLMLQNQDLLPHPTQRLAAVYLLYDMFRAEPISNNPFGSGLFQW